MKLIKIKTAILIILSFLTTNASFAQKYSGPTAFRSIVKYTGQQFLMSEVYNFPINSVKFLNYSIINKHIDLKEEFVLFVAAYSIDNNNGVVLTSVSQIIEDNLKNASKGSSVITNGDEKREYKNVNLKNDEFVGIINFFFSLNLESITPTKHIVKRITKDVIIDFSKEMIDLSKGDVRGNYRGIYSIWVGSNRHSFSVQQLKWMLEKYYVVIGKE